MRRITLLLMLITSLAFAQDTVKQCKYVNPDKKQCLIKGSFVQEDGYCYRHSPKTPHCGAETSKKQPCKMVVKKKGDRCKHHPGKPEMVATF